MKGRKWYSWKNDLRPFITGMSISASHICMYIYLCTPFNWFWYAFLKSDSVDLKPGTPYKLLFDHSETPWNRNALDQDKISELEVIRVKRVIIRE